MRVCKILAVSVLALALSGQWGLAGPNPLYGTGSISALDNLLAQGTWTLQIDNGPNKPDYFQAEFTVDTNGDNRFTDEDTKYKITGTPLNAISGVTVRCGPPVFIQFSVHVNANFDITRNGQQVATGKHGVIDFRATDQSSWFMILAVDLDDKDGLEAVTGTSFQFTPIIIPKSCP
ncbi:hypothetical protein HYR54_06920 [Candidatus Acetothermia bacterium]|nr:hypothetical protein [Candidatus Acetothermia bacterium]